MADGTASRRAGVLYVVATPIGNLDDITLRALKVLRAVSVVAAEDTRRTGLLLRHFDIRTPLLSVHEHNEQQRTGLVLDRIRAGESVALVTDAGTPAISDPGALVVQAVRDAGLPVVPIPGPSAVMAALSIAGITMKAFSFAGFPPIKSKDRKAWFAKLLSNSQDHPTVFFEAPHRILVTLGELAELVNRPIIVCRELTKIHEEILFAPPRELIGRLTSPKGEFSVIVPVLEPAARTGGPASEAEMVRLFGDITKNEPNLSKREALRKVSVVAGASQRTVYAALERSKKNEE